MKFIIIPFLLCCIINLSAQRISKNEVKILTSCADASVLLQKSTARMSKRDRSISRPSIRIDREKEFQEMDGFGFAITYSSCYNLLKMEKGQRMKFLKETYSPEGYGVSYARISLGCNDFSSTEYSLCDKPGLENFRLHSDETEYVIPILKEILTINPNLKIIAAPWTSPKWMKVKDLETMEPYDSWTDGHLNPALRDTYAEYFVRFIKEMKNNGIDIYAVSPQNEPLNKKNCASLYMPWDEQALFVKSLARCLRRNHLSTRIYVFDHNYNYDRIPDQEDYPVKLYKTLGLDYEGSDLVVGAAYHDYGGSNTELEDIHEKAGDKELIFTESSIGTWNDGRNLKRHLISDMRNIALGTINRWCKAVIVWNLMLDINRGPNLDGGCQTCYGAVDITMDYKTIIRNSHYYVIAHLSKVANPGSRRISHELSGTPEYIECSAFKNQDGTIALVILNTSDKEQDLDITDNNRSLSISMKPKSVKSLQWR